MVVYIGYGFNTNDISAKALVNLMRTYDLSEYNLFLDGLAEECDAEDEIEDYINEISMSVAEYLRDIINGYEKEYADTDYIVTCYDQYLVFDSIRFADDSKRTDYIRNQKDFIRMIDRYIPVDDLRFGNLYDGNDWMDPCYFLE